MSRAKLRVYADTSVFGGAHDEEFQKASAVFLAQVRAGTMELYTSALVIEELAAAPPWVRQTFEEHEPYAVVLPITADALDLRDAYVSAGIVGVQSLADALHVALATAGGCELIVSWNFSHIVNFNKIARYNAVNVLHGFHGIAIHSPYEVVGDE